MTWLSCIVSNILLASLLAMAAWFFQRHLRWHAVAHVLWVLVLVKLVTPPLVSLPIDGPRIRTACENGTCGCGPHWQTALQNRLPPAVLALWLIGASATGWSAWRRWTQFRLLTARSRNAPSEWRSQAARLSTELSLRRSPEILVVPGRLPPLVIPGWNRPRVLLPLELIDRLNGSQRTALLMHELMHLKRCDHLVRMLESAVRVVYWWLPLMGVIGRQLRACEESCCDAAVIEFQPNARRDYARLLLDVLDFVSPLPRAAEHATAMNSANELEQRLRTILSPGSESRRRRLVGMTAVALALVVLPCELRCDWVGKFALAAKSSAQSEPSPSFDDGCSAVPLKTVCCPS